MKKSIALFVVLIMLFSVTAHADAYDSLITNTKSGSVKLNLTVECDDPSVFQDVFPADDSEGIMNRGVFVNGLLDLSLDAEVDYEFNDDYSAGRVAVISDVFVPVKMNQNIEVTVKVKMCSWIVYDVSNESNPVIKLITLSPESDKYVVYNIVDLLKRDGYDNAEICMEIKKNINAENVNEFAEEIKTLYRANSTLTSKAGGYTLSMTDKQVETVFVQMLSMVEKTASSMHVAGYDSYSSLMFDFFGEDNEQMFEEVDFALVTEVKTDKNGNIQSDVSELAVSFDVESADGTMKPITLKLVEKCEYSTLKASSKIEIPELTDENSKMYEDFQYEDFEDYLVYDCTNMWTYGEYIPHKEDAPYVSLNSVLSELETDLHILDIKHDGDVIVISDVSDTEKFETVKLTVGSENYEIDSVLYIAKNPAVVVNDVVYVDITFIENVFGYTFSWGDINLIDKISDFSFSRDCTICEDRYEYEYDDDYNIDCWHIQSMEMPLELEAFNDGYFGLRAAVEQHCLRNSGKGQIDIFYDNGVITLKNNGSYEYFNEARIIVGSSVVTVDGVDINVSLPAVNRGGTVYVDEDTIKAIWKYEIDSAQIYYYGTWTSDDDYILKDRKTASFKRVSPTCVHYNSIEQYYEE